MKTQVAGTGSSSLQGARIGLGEMTILGLVFIVGLVLRLYNLSHESIWYDEAYSLRVCSSGVGPLLRGETADPGNPAGYFVMLATWQKFFGPTIEAARAFSALAGAFTIPAIWLLANAVGLSRNARLTACALATISPPLVYLSREARCYALFITLVTLLAAAAESCVKRNRLRDWIAFVVLGAASVHVHYYGFFILVALGMRILLGCLRPKNSPAGRFDFPRFGRLVICSVAIGLLFAPYLKILRWQLSLGSSRSGETWVLHLFLFPLYSLAGRTLVWKEDGNRIVAIADGMCAMLVFVPLIPAIFANRRRLATPIAASVGVLFVAFGVSVYLSPMIHSHYISSAIPPILLFVAYGIVDASKTKRWRIALVGGTALLVSAVSLFGLFARIHKTDWRGVADFVQKNADGLPVYFFEDIGADPYRYYRPNDDCRLIVTDPGDDGREWSRSGWLAGMEAESRGFVLVFYATNAANRFRLPDCRYLLIRNFGRFDEQVFGPIGPIHVFKVTR